MMTQFHREDLPDKLRMEALQGVYVFVIINKYGTDMVQRSGFDSIFHLTICHSEIAFELECPI